MAGRSFGISLVMLYTILTLEFVLPFQIQIVGICETKFMTMCQNIFNTTFETTINRNQWNLQNNLKSSVNITWKFIECGSDFMLNVHKMEVLNENLSGIWSIGIVIGNAPVVNAAVTYANSSTMPMFVYDTSKHKTPLYESSFIPLYADKYHFGQATRKLIGEITIHSTCFVTPNQNQAIGFLEGFWNSGSIGTFMNRTFEIQRDSTEKDIFLKLQSMQEHNCKLIISDCDMQLNIRLINVSMKFMDYPHNGFVWLLTGELPGEENAFLPDGLLLVGRNEEYEELYKIINRTAISVNTAAKHIFNSLTTFSSKSDFKEFVYELITSVEYNESNEGLSFDARHTRTNISYRISNKDSTKTGGYNSWQNIGYFSNLNQHFNSITWPGNSLFGPIGKNEGRFCRRVVTRPAEPFVFVKEHNGTCYGEVPCIKIIYGYPRLYPRYITNDQSDNFLYKNYCCSGVAVDVLHRLSIDMKFDYILYFEDDNDKGTHHENDTWTGMLGDLVKGTADIAIGAFSIRSEFYHDVLYTEPFYISGYSMVTPSEPASPSMDAFLAPLHWSVWSCIFLSATVTGFATSILEWNSPFGLNPWGKKRIKNYTLGSGLVMAYSVLFGHTVSTKTPKSWPSKVLQNFWAGLAIFIVASYTANLAAYLAGNTGQNYFKNIYDEKLNEKRLSATRSSSVINYLQKVNPSLSTRVTQFDYSRTMDAISYLRQGKTDVYFDDTVSLAYALSLNDTNCSVTFSGRVFGERLYSFALQNKDSWFKDQLSSLILHYVESGHIENMARKYTPKRECKDTNNVKGPQYGLEHTGGLFIMLVCAILLAILLLGLEHSVYRCFVPFVRKKPSNSRWKSRNMEYLNQRLFRTIMSQKLVSPQQTAREMVKLMKDRQFTRLFQKNELKSPRVPQKPDNKGLRFINLTDSLMRIKKPTEENKTMFDSNDNSVLLFTTSSSGTLYKVTEEEEEEVIQKEEESEQNPSLASFSINFEDEHSVDDEPTLNTTVSRTALEMPQETSTPNNLKHPEEGSVENNFPQRMDSFCTGGKVKVNCLWKRYSCIEKRARDYEAVSKGKDSRQRISSDSKMEDTVQNPQISELHRKFGTWPTLPSSEDLLAPVSHHKTRDYRSSPSVSSEDFELPVNELSSEKGFMMSNRPEVDNDESSIEVDSSNYYKHSLKMKDNRVKSTIRRHAIAKYRRQSSSMFDECAVDALTKEDLLVLWKRSEIELQTKLNRVTLQNAHLKRLLRMVDQKRSDADEGEDTTQFLCTRL